MRRLFSIIRMVVGYVARQYLLRRRLTRCRQIRHRVSLLNFKGDIPAEKGLERGLYSANHAIRIMTADGELYIFPDGHRLLFPRPR